MRYLTEEELVWSPVVANCRMNRTRKATGVNSYEREFRFHIGEWLTDRVKQKGTAAWLDLCCGEANALAETEQYLVKNGTRDKVILAGMDMVLDRANLKASGIRLQEKTLQEWEVQDSFDVITCSHGLHYVGDKVQAIVKACSALKPDGLFMAHLDVSHICIRNCADPIRHLKNWFKCNNIEYNIRSRLLSANEPISVTSGLIYLGADDAVGPNYTGQDAVASYYDLF